MYGVVGDDKGEIESHHSEADVDESWGGGALTEWPVRNKGACVTVVAQCTWGVHVYICGCNNAGTCTCAEVFNFNITLDSRGIGRLSGYNL